MALLDDIKRMQAEGRTDPEIISALKQQGVSPREITDALTQSKIKQAVSAPETGGYETSAPAPAGEMTPSMAQSSEYAPSESAGYAQTQEAYAPAPAQEAYPQQAQQAYPEYGAPAQAYPSEYPQYQQEAAPAVGGISPDTITEISEQVVAEKIAPLRTDIEKVIDMKTTVDSKMDYLDERLKRIEKIIDRLQLSIMQKVGDYMTNIEDIKKEVQENQKSFKSMSGSKPQAEKPRRAKETEKSE